MEHTFAAAVAAILLTSGIIAGFYALEDHPENREEAFDAESVSSVSEEEEEKILLGVYDEKLALFLGESPYPNIIYDFFVRNLPPEDRLRLEEGITVSSESELESLLEDFMS